MKINVSKIPEGGMDLRFEKDGAWFRGFLPEAEPFDFTLQRIDCRLQRQADEGDRLYRGERDRLSGGALLPLSGDGPAAAPGLVQIYLCPRSRPSRRRRWS